MKHSPPLPPPSPSLSGFHNREDLSNVPARGRREADELTSLCRRPPASLNMQMRSRRVTFSHKYWIMCCSALFMPVDRRGISLAAQTKASPPRVTAGCFIFNSRGRKNQNKEQGGSSRLLLVPTAPEESSIRAAAVLQEVRPSPGGGRRGSMARKQFRMLARSRARHACVYSANACLASVGF